MGGLSGEIYWKVISNLEVGMLILASPPVPVEVNFFIPISKRAIMDT